MNRAAAPKVALIAPLPPLRGGIAHHSDEVRAALARVGADVACVGYERVYPRALFPGRSETAPSSSPTLLTSSRNDAAPPRVLVPHHPTTWSRADRLLAAHAPDVIVAPYWHWWLAAPLTALLARRRVSCAAVLIAHNARTHAQGTLADAAAQTFDSVAWRMLRRVVDRVVVAGERDAALLEARGLRTQALRHPPYHRFFAPPSSSFIGRTEARRRLGLREDGALALCFGLVRPYKGIDVAAQAIASLPRDVRLCIVGESYVAPARLASWIAPLPKERVVRVDRYLDDDEVALWFAAADVVLAPYHAASDSGAAQIARAFGVPVVATDVGNLRASALEVVAPGDAHALSAAIARVLERSTRAERAEPLSHHDATTAWDDYARALLSFA